MTIGARHAKSADVGRLMLLSAFAAIGAMCDRPALAATDAAAPVNVTVSVSSTPAGPAVPRMFMGYSIEWGLIGRMVRKKQGRFAVIARSINGLEQFTGPMLLRIGGDSESEAAFDLPALRHRPKFVGINIRIRTLKRMRELARKTRCEYVLGLNLASDRPELAVRLVKAAVRYLGRRHIADFEIGNEPDLLGGMGHRTWWSGNNYQMYLRRWTRYDRAIAHYLGKSIKIEGPAFSGESWFEHLPAYLQREHRRLGIVSLHNYPMGAWIKNRRSLKYASISHLLGSRAVNMFGDEMRRIVRLAAPYHLPVRFGEMNSVSGGGKEGVSNTFASTIWAAATLLGVAQAGGAGVNLHMSQGIDRFPGWYGPLRFGPKGHLHIMPVYVGMLAAADVMQRGGSPLPVQRPKHKRFSAFAFERSNHSVRVAMMNRTPSINMLVHLHLPGNMKLIRCYRIDAPSLSATKGITITGFRLSGTPIGRLGHTRLPLKPAGRHYRRWPVPAKSIVIAVFHGGA